MSERLATVISLRTSGNALEDEALVRARPERDYEVRLLAGYGSLYRRSGATPEERRLAGSELILLLHSLNARFEVETLLELRGDLHPRDVRILLGRPRPDLPQSAERERLRELADAEGFNYYQQRRNDEQRQRLDRRIDRAITTERAVIATWLRARGVPAEIADAVRQGIHLDDGPGGGSARPHPRVAGSAALAD